MLGVPELVDAYVPVFGMAPCEKSPPPKELCLTQATKGIVVVAVVGV